MQKIKSLIIKFLILALTTEVFSCGYILYPHRRGQSAGPLDWGVVLLDTIGLLFFIVPGVVAFAVDIGSGTIYLTNNVYEPFQDYGEIQKIKIDPNNINNETIAAAIRKNNGQVVNLNDPHLKIYRSEQWERKILSQR